MLRTNNTSFFENLATVVLAMLVGVIFGASINNSATARASQEVYKICNDARQEVNGTSEQSCGEVQDKYSMEFLCDSNNNNPATHCWVEVK